MLLLFSLLVTKCFMYIKASILLTAHILKLKFSKTQLLLLTKYKQMVIKAFARVY